MNKTKRCLGCKIVFETDKLHPFQKYCNRKCYIKTYYLKNQDKIKKYLLKTRIKRLNQNLQWHYKKFYGITIVEKNELYKIQNGECLICGEKKNILVIDHNHKNQKIRGLLCRNCNSMIGMAKENLKILYSAIKYLRKNND